MLIFNLFARDQPISEGEREQKNKVVDIHSERMRASERDRERAQRKTSLSLPFLLLFNHVYTISNYNSRFSNLSVSHFPFFSFVELILFIIRVFQVMEKIRRQWWQWISTLSFSWYSSFPIANNLISVIQSMFFDCSCYLLFFDHWKKRADHH